MTDTRDEFEHHFRLTIRQRRRNRNGEYCYVDIQAKWEGWHAREQLMPAWPLQANSAANPTWMFPPQEQQAAPDKPADSWRKWMLGDYYPGY